MAFAEKMFRANQPLRLAARIDRAYFDGEALILVELKTRRLPRTFASDIIELSAQRVAIQNGSLTKVREHGYVLTLDTTTRQTKAHRVALLSEESIFALVHRREAILSGIVEPTAAAVQFHCQGCEYKEECRLLNFRNLNNG